jgi:DNA-binding SARP family transcriptional activator
MVRLVALGGLALINAAGAVVAEQRRRLALLALLGSTGERGLTRDKLLGYLWPEHPAEHARHALEQLLYHLRRQVSDNLFLGRDPLRIDPRVVAVDVVEFEAAVAEGEHARAVELYRGPFLDGFYLNAAPAFEVWVEGERARLAAAQMRALVRLAEQEREAGHHTAEIECWRRVSQVDPIGSRAALGLMRALARAGDLAGALWYARVYAERVWKELEAAPDPAVMACAEELRQRAGQAPGANRSRPPPTSDPA